MPTGEEVTIEGEHVSLDRRTITEPTGEVISNAAEPAAWEER